MVITLGSPPVVFASWLFANASSKFFAGAGEPAGFETTGVSADGPCAILL